MKQRRYPKLRAATLALVALVTVAPQAPAADATLFARLGGVAGLQTIVEEFTQVVLDDERINFTFGDIDIARFKQLLYDQLCELSGGPCRYTGRDMLTSHAKLSIDDAQFNALAEDLYVAMERVRVGYRTQNELMALLAPMQRDIVRQ
jgi:hemoglobin